MKKIKHPNCKGRVVESDAEIFYYLHLRNVIHCKKLDKSSGKIEKFFYIKSNDK